jgi:hypothetical protein
MAIGHKSFKKGRTIFMVSSAFKNTGFDSINIT